MDVYGPPLPPGFKLAANDDSESEDDQPEVKVIGPQIPLHLAQKKPESNSSSSESEEESQSNPVIGPVLPGSRKRHHPDSSDNEHDDFEVYGPMPPQTKVDYDVINIIEKRAANMKNKIDNKDIPVAESCQREEWMVLPDTSRRNQLGVISRCLAPGSKVEKKRETEYHNPEEEEKITEALKKYNKKKRSESLLDMHSKKLKKKDKKEKKSKDDERKPFDRDEMAVRHFSKEQVNSVIDKAKYLNTRFAPGKKHYL